MDREGTTYLDKKALNKAIQERIRRIKKETGNE